MHTCIHCECTELGVRHGPSLRPKMFSSCDALLYYWNRASMAERVGLPSCSGSTTLNTLPHRFSVQTIFLEATDNVVLEAEGPPRERERDMCVQSSHVVHRKDRPGVRAYIHTVYLHVCLYTRRCLDAYVWASDRHGHVYLEGSQPEWCISTI